MPSLIQTLQSILILVQDEKVVITAAAAAVLAAITDLFEVQGDALAASTRLTLGHRPFNGMLIVIGDR